MNNVTHITCIMCPLGCNLTVTQSGKNITVTGNACIRGEQYGKQEVVNPKRIVTALVKTKDGVLPVKTTLAVPKKLVFSVVKEINKLNLKKANFGDIIIKNVLNTGADVIITGEKVDYEI